MIAAYQGRPGAYSELAARRLLGAHAELVCCDTFVDAVALLVRGAVSHCVLPVHNTLAGFIADAIEPAEEARLEVAGKISLPISHALIGVPGAMTDSVRIVRSHPVALAQCRKFFARNPQLRPMNDFDTAGAAETMLRNQDPAVAAIASAHVARLYGGVILLNAIEDEPDNVTRFRLFQMPA